MLSFKRFSPSLLLLQVSCSSTPLLAAGLLAPLFLRPACFTLVCSLCLYFFSFASCLHGYECMYTHTQTNSTIWQYSSSRMGDAMLGSGCGMSTKTARISTIYCGRGGGEVSTSKRGPERLTWGGAAQHLPCAFGTAQWIPGCLPLD